MDMGFYLVNVKFSFYYVRIFFIVDFNQSTNQLEQAFVQFFFILNSFFCVRFCC